MHEPFTLAQARAAGISPGHLRGKRFQRLFSQVYVDASVEVTLRVKARAALLLVPDGLISHHTALALLTGIGDTCDVHLGIRRDPRRSVPRVGGITVHEVATLNGWSRAGLPMTTPARTFTDVAHVLDPTELVVAGDALARRTGIAPEDLVTSAAAFHGRGARRARTAARLVRARVDSPMESRLRMLLIGAGLPEPLANVDVMYADGGWLGRPDLQYRREKIAIEYDGRHHLEPGQWRNDLRRRENYAREGWLMRIVTATDLHSSPTTLLALIHEDLLARQHPGAPLQLSCGTAEPTLIRGCRS